MAALGAGAAAGVSDTASTAVTDAYSGLKALTRKALRRSGREDERLPERLADPEAHRDELVAALAAAGAGQDAELIAAAAAMLRLTGQRGKYVIDVHDNKGVQIGDGNTMTLDFDE